MRRAVENDIVKLIQLPGGISIETKRKLQLQIGNYFRVSNQHLMTYNSKLLTTTQGFPIFFSPRCYKLEILNYKLYKIGDTVKVRKLTQHQMESLERLISGNNTVGSNREMENLAGKIFKIKSISFRGLYILNIAGARKYSWQPYWLIPKRIK